MDPGIDDSRRLVLVVSVVVVAIFLSTVGMRSLTGNPAIPDLDTTVSGTDDPFAVDRPGEVRICTIEHRRGDAIEFTELAVVVGTRADGLVFSSVTNWTASVGPLTYRLDRPDRSPDSDRFDPGDRLVLRKVEGTFQPPPTVNVTVRLLHRPSQQTIARHDLQFQSRKATQS